MSADMLCLAASPEWFHVAYPWAHRCSLPAGHAGTRHEARRGHDPRGESTWWLTPPA